MAKQDVKPLYDSGTDIDENLPPNTVHADLTAFHVGQEVKTPKGNGKITKHKDGVFTVAHHAESNFKGSELEAVPLPDPEPEAE